MDKNLMKNNKGATMVLFALMTTVLMGFGAIAVDVGRVSIEKQKMQNAIDATVLAAAQDLPDTAAAAGTAVQYIQANGYGTSDIQVTFSESDKVVHIDGAEQIEYTLAKIIGFNNATIYASASARKTSSFGQVLNYQIFSGNPYPGGFSVRVQNLMSISGSDNIINGSVHSNYNIAVSGTDTAISGTCEAVGSIDINGGPEIPNMLSGAPFVPIPDLSPAVEEIKEEAQAAGNYYAGDFSRSICGTNLDITHSVYIEGNADLTGMTISGEGCIYVNGKITISGSDTTYTSSSNICMYSAYTSSNYPDEAITFNGSDKNFKGILYAPNGSISVTGSNYTFDGSIIGKVVNISGSNKIFNEVDVSGSFPYKNIISLIN